MLVKKKNWSEEPVVAHQRCYGKCCRLKVNCENKLDLYIIHLKLFFKF